MFHNIYLAHHYTTSTGGFHHLEVPTRLKEADSCLRRHHYDLITINIDTSWRLVYQFHNHNNPYRLLQLLLQQRRQPTTTPTQPTTTPSPTTTTATATTTPTQRHVNLHNASSTHSTPLPPTQRHDNLHNNDNNTSPTYTTPRQPTTTSTPP